jgi:hypothetical protein
MSHPLRFLPSPSDITSQAFEPTCAGEYSSVERTATHAELDAIYSSIEFEESPGFIPAR